MVILTPSICIAGCSESSKNSEVIDVAKDEIIDNVFSDDRNVTESRYKSVEKDNLTYELGTDATAEGLKNPYFYLTDEGITLDLEVNRPFKPITNKKYGKVLLGYSFGNLEQPLSKEDALSKAKLVLPDDAKEITSQPCDDYELVRYSTSKGEFIVYLGYKVNIDEKTNANINDTTKYQSLGYYKEF